MTDQPLSPSAQAVLDAVAAQMEGEWISPDFIPYEAKKIAAALRAAADQVVPDDGVASSIERIVEKRIRSKLLAIAAELDGIND